jgi:hypothetical protein
MEAKTGNGRDGNWKKNARDNNVKGRPIGGIAWCGNTA